MKTKMLAAVVAAGVLVTSAHAASWSITPYAGIPGAIYAQPTGMNDQGILVVQASNGSYIDDHGVLTSYAGFGPHDFGGLTDISNGGVLVGNQNGIGFVDDHGVVTNLAVSGAAWTTASSISANGRYVSGIYGTSPDQHSQEGFVYDRTTATYSTILAPVDQYVDAVGGVNDAGQAVGDFSDYDYDGTSFLFDAVTGTRQEIDRARPDQFRIGPRPDVRPRRPRDRSRPHGGQRRARARLAADVRRRPARLRRRHGTRRAGQAR